MKLDVNVDALLTDIFKPITVGMVVRLMSGKSLKDNKWQTTLMFTVTGYVLYHVLVASVVDTEDYFHKSQLPVANEVIKTFSQMALTDILSDTELDAEWFMSILATVAGNVVYRVFTTGYIKGEKLYPDTRMAEAVNDWAKTGTAGLVTPVLRGNAPLSPKNLTELSRKMVGLGAFHGLVAPVIDSYFLNP